MCYINFGLLILLTVFSFGHAKFQCNQPDAQDLFNKIKESMLSTSEDAEYVQLYLEMMENNQDFEKYLFFCEESEKLFEKWGKFQQNLLSKVEKSCPNFKNNYAEMRHCRQILDAYNMNIDQTKYCSNYKKCMEMRQSFCSPMKEIVFLKNQQSNASIYFCTVDCDNIPALRRNLENCWTSTHQEGSSSQIESFFNCVLGSQKPTCKITKQILSRILPLFSVAPYAINPEPVSEKPDQCSQHWRALKNLDNLDARLCKTLQDIRPCITKFLKDEKLYKEKIAKCEYSVVNLIRTEALHQSTVTPTSAPSTAAGKMGSNAYHSIVICWLVTMLSCYFSNIF